MVWPGEMDSPPAAPPFKECALHVRYAGQEVSIPVCGRDDANCCSGGEAKDDVAYQRGPNPSWWSVRLPMASWRS